MERDKYGNYVNDEGVTIKVTRDSNGNDHISCYDKPVDEEHSAVHVNIDYDKKSYNTTYHNEDDSEKDKSSGSCYLTTACMEHYLENFDDNCHELTVLRWFRDNFVSKEDIEHYYQIAPVIVSAIESEKHLYSIYDYIYESVVEYCVNAIEKGDYTKAYVRYKNSILKLKETFVIPQMEKEFVRVLK